MKKGGGRAKGNSFERQVARLVVTAFACMGIKKRDCYRTPSSGGHKYAKKSDPGDLVVSKRLRKLFPFHVEAKHYRQIKMWPLWMEVDKQKRAWKFKRWLEQTTKAAGRKLYPMLVFKENNSPVFCMIPEIVPLTTRIRVRHRTWFRDEKWFVMLLSDVLRELVREAKEPGK